MAHSPDSFQRRYLLLALLGGHPHAWARPTQEVRLWGNTSTDLAKALVQALLGQGVDAATGAATSKLLNLTLGLAGFKAWEAQGKAGQALALWMPRASADAPMNPPAVSGLFAEPLPEAQVATALALFGSSARLAAMRTEATRPWAQRITLAAKRRGVELVWGDFGVQTPVRDFAQLGPADALLAAPDPGLWTPENFKGLLQASYRRSLGVVGFSQGMVQAGALAAPFIPTECLAPHVAKIIKDWSAGKPLPEADYVPHWRVSINEAVARSRNMVVSDHARNLTSANEKVE